MDYPLELLVEIVDFLTSRGVIQGPIVSRTVPTHGAAVMGTPPASTGAIPLPRIQKKDGTIAAPVVPTANIDPLASFDITMSSHTESPPMGSPQVNINTPPIPEIVRADDSKIKASSVNNDPAIAKRAVIRTRVKKGDPLSAEREAAQLRAAQIASKGKTIKKAHTVGED